MISQKIIDKALESADAAQVTIISKETSGVDFENDRLKSAESSQRTQIDLKVILDGKVGMSSTTDPNDVQGVVKRALEAAQFGREAHFKLPTPQEIKDVEIFDPSLLELDKPEMICTGQEMIDMIKTYNPDILTYATINKNVYTFEYTNSNGATYSADHTDYNIGAGGQLVRGTDILFAESSLGQKKRDTDTEEIAAKGIELFQYSEYIAPVESGDYPVIFLPEGLVLLLLSLYLAADGKNVLLGSSPLRDKLEEEIAYPGLTIIDDPFIPFGPVSSAFDNEGIARQVTPIIEKGILKNFIYDLDTAARAGADATGHGDNRDWTNIVIEAGDVSVDDMVKGIDDGLLVKNFLGVGQGNPINGEFSVNVSLGFKIEKGKIVGRVKDVMLAGNAFSAFKNITAISKEREWVSGPYSYINGFFPYIQVDKLSITAKD